MRRVDQARTHEDHSDKEVREVTKSLLSDVRWNSAKGENVESINRLVGLGIRGAGLNGTVDKVSTTELLKRYNATDAAGMQAAKVMRKVGNMR